MADLKPCPFCGGEAEMVKTRVSFMGVYTGEAVRVRCKKCLCTVPYKWGQENMHGWFAAGYEPEAIEAWNRRVHDD